MFCFILISFVVQSFLSLIYYFSTCLCILCFLSPTQFYCNQLISYSSLKSTGWLSWVMVDSGLWTLGFWKFKTLRKFITNLFFFQNRQLCKEYKTLKQAWLKKIERNENNPKRKWVHRSAHYDYSLLVNKSSLFYWIAKKGWTAILMNHNNFLSNWIIHDIRFRVIIVFINN